MQSKPSVVFLTNIYTPYKEPLLARLAELVNLTVYYCAHIEHNRRWEVRISGAYRYVIMPGIVANIRGMILHFNPSVIWRLLRDRPDVAIIGGYSSPTSWMAALTCRFLRIPSLLWSGSTHLEKDRSGRLSERFKQRFLRLFSGYVAYTSRAAQYLESLGARPNKITVAPVTVDTRLYSERASSLRADPGKERIREELGCPPDSIVVIFVAQLVEFKALDVLLQALAALRDINLHLLVAGHGPAEEKWKRLAESLGLTDRIRWSGHLEQEELTRHYVAADIMAHPSRMERAGRVINEAMATGLPVIISDRVGSEAIRDGVDGFIVPVNNSLALAERIRQLALDAELRALMGESARQHLLNDFTIENEANQFVAAIEAALARNSVKAVNK